MKFIKICIWIIPLLLFSGCEKSEEENKLIPSISTEIKYEYENVLEYHIEWKNMLSLDGEYYAYIYSPTCGHCREIKQDIIEARLSHGINVYYIKYNKDINIVDNGDELIDKDSIDDLGILGTPSMFEINNHKVKGYYAGKTAIIETLTNLYNV